MFVFWLLRLCFDFCVCVLTFAFVFWLLRLCFGFCVCVLHLWATVLFIENIEPRIELEVAGVEDSRPRWTNVGRVSFLVDSSLDIDRVSVPLNCIGSELPYIYILYVLL